MLSNIIPEGFKDDVSSSVISEHNFKNKIIYLFISNGFQLVKTPLIEYFHKETEKNVFKVLVDKNQDKLNIRDDITLQVARLSQTRLSKSIGVLKLCYYGEVIRKKGTMLRPERQFLQIGAECIGEVSYLADVEMMELAYNSLELVGIKKITINLTSRIFVDIFLENLKKSKNIKEIKRLIKLKDLNGLLKILDLKFHKFIKDLFSCTGLYKFKKNYLKKLAINKKTSDEISKIESIIKIFSTKVNNDNIFIDFCEFDDKNYHSGVRFTFFAEKVRGEIANGGRYFVKGPVNKTTATGFTCYMDSILRASKYKMVQKKILVPFNISIKKSDELFKKNLSLFKYAGDLKITKKLAKEQNCQYYLDNNSIKSI